LCEEKGEKNFLKIFFSLLLFLGLSTSLKFKKIEYKAAFSASSINFFKKKKNAQNFAVWYENKEKGFFIFFSLGEIYFLLKKYTSLANFLAKISLNS
jgi:hypothetical protein